MQSDRHIRKWLQRNGKSAGLNPGTQSKPL